MSIENVDTDQLISSENNNKNDVLFQLWKRDVYEHSTHFERYHNYFITFVDKTCKNGKPKILLDNLLYTDAKHRIDNTDILRENYYDYKASIVKKKLLWIITIIIMIIILFFYYGGNN